MLDVCFIVETGITVVTLDWSEIVDGYNTADSVVTRKEDDLCHKIIYETVFQQQILILLM